MATSSIDADDDLRIILSEQRLELTSAQTLESDLDLAFHLQMQEALTASLPLPLPPSTSSSSSSLSKAPQPPLLFEYDDDDLIFATLMTEDEELAKLEQIYEDRELSEAEMRRMRDDLSRRIHDQKVASDISRISEEEWEKYGDNFERPYGEGSSSTTVLVDEGFRVYFKGLVSEERVRDSKVTVAAIGVAICDQSDNLIFELRKPLVGRKNSLMSREVVEIEALIEGLNAAIDFDLKKVTCFCDEYMIHQYVTGRLPPTQTIATLINQVALLQKKFTYCNPSLVARNDIKLAFKLARDAIVSQITWPAETNRGKNLMETCVICFEDTDVGQMFSVDGCLHRYCFSCMKQHVEVKLLHGMGAKCPHEGCKSEVDIDSCGKFLAPKLVEIMSQRIKEASIPVSEKVYCPYPRCSALMSKSVVLEYSKNSFVGAEQSGARKCSKCCRFFCINCKVPWHYNMTCNDYKRSNPHPCAEDAKLKSLATKSLWRQCAKCNHMIELAEGCYHIYCRCGFEFCYTCGAEWKNKKATCSCPLWTERNIIRRG